MGPGRGAGGGLLRLSLVAGGRHRCLDGRKDRESYGKAWENIWKIIGKLENHGKTYGKSYRKSSNIKNVGGETSAQIMYK